MYEHLKPGEGLRQSGLIIIETDDLLGGGIGPKFQYAIEELQKIFKFGSWHWLMERSRQYGGRTLFQRADFSFTVDMNRYLKDRAHEIKIATGRKPEMDATPTEVSAGRGLMGSLNWATREGMPQGCGDCSMIASSFPKPKVQDVLDMNAFFRRLKKDAVVIQIFSIPLDRLTAPIFSDASLAEDRRSATSPASPISPSLTVPKPRLAPSPTRATV